MEPDENQAEIFRIAEKAAKPYMMRAAQAAEALKLRDAFENCSFGFMASLKVLEAEDDIVRRDLGVPRCCGAFTPSTRLVSIRRGRGWFIFRF